MGKFGSFELEISEDGSRMTWDSDLENLDLLAAELGLDGFPILNYHLHQQWTNTEEDFAIGGEGCGPSVTGGHYDPFFGVRNWRSQPALKMIQHRLIYPTSLLSVWTSQWGTTGCLSRDWKGTKR